MLARLLMFAFITSFVSCASNPQSVSKNCNTEPIMNIGNSRL